MRLYRNYHFEGIKGVYNADPPNVITTCYEFDTKEEMNASGLLDDPRRTTCFTSSGKYYVGGHFKPDLVRCDICDAFDHDSGGCCVPRYACPLEGV